MKKRKGREARVDTPIEELDTKETITHYNAVLLEEQNSNFRLVLERMEALSEHVDRKIDALRVDLDAFRNHSERRFSTLERAIRGLKDDMLDMERCICSKINRITERCESHDCRLTALEAHQ